MGPAPVILIIIVASPSCTVVQSSSKGLCFQVATTGQTAAFFKVRKVTFSTPCKHYFCRAMRYRKFKADKLFTGSDLLDGENVLIIDDRGRVEAIVHYNEAGDDVQVLKGWLTPGFVNCHCHLELSHMRGLIPEKTGLIDFVFSVVTQRHFPEEEILQAIAVAEEEMIKNGIVAVGDICNTAHTLKQKQQHNLSYYNFVEATGWLPTVAEQRFQRSKEMLDAFEVTGPSSLVPHAPYSVSNDLWQQIQPYFAGKVTSIHNQETRFEDELFQHNTGAFVTMYGKMNIDHAHFQPTGRTSLQSYFDKLRSASTALLVHNTFTQQHDISFAQTRAAAYNQEVFWCICVNANQYIENALPPVELLRSEGQQIVLGTDSLASNWSLSIWDEIKTIRKNFPSIPLHEVLQWATLNGATALKMNKTIGSFEKGKMPGINLIDEAAMSVKKIV